MLRAFNNNRFLGDVAGRGNRAVQPGRPATEDYSVEPDGERQRVVGVVDGLDTGSV